MIGLMRMLLADFPPDLTLQIKSRIKVTLDTIAQLKHPLPEFRLILGGSHGAT